MYLDKILEIALASHDFTKVQYILSLGGLVRQEILATHLSNFTLDQITFILKQYPQLYGENGYLICLLIDRHLSEDIINLAYNIYIDTCDQKDTHESQRNNKLETLLQILIYHEHYSNKLVKRILFNDLIYITNVTLNSILLYSLRENNYLVNTIDNQYDLFLYIIDNFKNKRCKLLLEYSPLPKDIIMHCIKPYLDCGIIS